MVSKVIGLQTAEKINGKPDLAEIEGILQDHDIFLEVLPYKGVIDHDKKTIYVNPAVGSPAEILAHEALHGLYPNTTEWYIRETAKEFVSDPGNKEYLENYLDTHARLIPKKDLFSGAIGW